MLGTHRWLKLMLAAVLVVAGAACIPGGIDSGSSADVVLEVTALDNPPVTGQVQGTACAFTVEDWTATLQNQPKSELATTSPFNDIVLVDVDIVYTFINAAIVVPMRTVGLGDVVIEAGGSNTVGFAPISFDDLLSNPAIQGSTANLELTFHARTVEGATISDTVYRQLFVETCSSGSGP